MIKNVIKYISDKIDDLIEHSKKVKYYKGFPILGTFKKDYDLNKGYVHVIPFDGITYYNFLKNKKFHRENGPAIECVFKSDNSSHSDKEYYFDGKYYPNITSDEEWIKLCKKLNKLKAFQ